MIQFAHENGMVYPFLKCDQCGGKVVDAGLALVGFFDAQRSQVGPAALLHKKCADEWVERHRRAASQGGPEGLEWLWHEATLVFSQALENAGMRAQERENAPI